MFPISEWHVGLNSMLALLHVREFRYFSFFFSHLKSLDHPHPLFSSYILPQHLSESYDTSCVDNMGAVVSTPGIMGVFKVLEKVKIRFFKNWITWQRVQGLLFQRCPIINTQGFVKLKHFSLFNWRKVGYPRHSWVRLYGMLNCFIWFRGSGSRIWASVLDDFPPNWTMGI